MKVFSIFVNKYSYSSSHLNAQHKVLSSQKNHKADLTIIKQIKVTQTEQPLLFISKLF